MASNNDSFVKTVVVAFAVCLVASIVVSVAAVQLKPAQQKNKLLDKQKNILAVAGFDVNGQSSGDLAKMFEDNIEARIVDVALGEFTDEVDVASYDQRKAAKDPAQNVSLDAADDIAKIRSRAKYATVYLVKEQGQVKYYILPIHGYGLWSTLYGFVAVEADANTIFGLSFYEHAETPGLGGEVDNPKWKSQWVGKHIADTSGNLAIQVVKSGLYDPAADNAIHTVDGLAGASLTTIGVDNLVKFWLSDTGFGPFLSKLKQS